MGKIVRLEVENFKSYGGSHVIGPFHAFTAIIGPNGSGKSNLMDAVSFVLGIQSKILRSDKLGDLIYNVNHGKGKKRCRVNLVYQPSDSEIIKDVDAENFVRESEGEADSPHKGKPREMMFSRLLKVSEKGVTISEFKFQGKTVSYEEYNKHLRSIGVLVKARNFLVFQGDVESIASKDSNDMTAFFEEISGSMDFKARYDELKLAKENAERYELAVVNEMKAISKEKSQVQEQQKKSELYQKKKQELAELQLDYFLWQLFQVKRSVETLVSEKSNVEQELVEVCNREETILSQLEKSNEKIQELTKKLIVLEKTRKKTNAQVKEQESNLIKSKEMIELAEKRVAGSSTEIQLLKKAQLQKQKELKSLEKDLKSIDSAVYELTEKFGQHESKSKDSSNRLTPAQLKELEEVRDQAQFETIVERGELQSLTLERELKSEAVERLKATIDTLASEKRDILSEENIVTAECSEKRQELIRLEEALKIRQKETEIEKKTVRVLEARKKVLITDLSSVALELDDLNIVNQEDSRGRKAFEEAQILKKKYKGIYGRLVDLIQPKQKEYEVALTAALGKKNLEAIVCDSFVTANECSDYLLEHGMRAKSFLPINALKLKPKHSLNRERLRHFSTSNSQSFRLAFDVISYDRAIEKAVDFSLGDTVICDTLDDARYFVYTKKEHTKVVTLRGEVISADGASMTGGSLSIGQGNQFAKKKTDDLLRKLEQLDNERLDVENQLAVFSGPSLGTTLGHTEVSDVQLKNQAIHIQSQLELLEARREKLKINLESCQRKESSANEGLKVAEEELQLSLRNISSLQEQVQNVEDGLFSKFALRHGLSNVQLSEQRTLEENRIFQEKLTKLKDQKIKLEGRLSYHKGIDLDASLLREVGKLERYQEEVNEIASTINKDTEELRMLKKAFEDVSDEIQAQKKQISDEKVGVEDSLLRSKEIKFAKEEILKKKTKIESKLEKMRAERHEILEEAIMEKVSIPTTKGIELQRLSSVEVIDGSSSSDAPTLTQSTLEADGGYTGTIPQSSLGFSQEDSKVVRYDNLLADAIHFEGFLKKCKQPRFRDRFNGTDISTTNTPKDRELARSSFQRELKEIRDAISEMKPNLNSIDDLKDVAQRLKSTNSTLKTSSDARKHIQQEFDEVRKERLTKFTQMYDHVADQIDRIYKDLTKSREHPIGGSASLLLEIGEKPWEGGIRYTATPPGKRFRDMGQLSGGEKTVAALALLFSIHSYHPAPFFVMDEVDAALDNVNVYKVSNFIKQNSNNFQCIVISLKDQFYDKANALVGVYKDQEENSSGVLTLDLDECARRAQGAR